MQYVVTILEFYLSDSFNRVLTNRVLNDKDLYNILNHNYKVNRKDIDTFQSLKLNESMEFSFSHKISFIRAFITRIN